MFLSNSSCFSFFILTLIYLFRHNNYRFRLEPQTDRYLKFQRSSSRTAPEDQWLDAIKEAINWVNDTASYS